MSLELARPPDIPSFSIPELLMNDDSSSVDISSSVQFWFALSLNVLVCNILVSDSSFLASFFLSFRNLILIGNILGRTLSDIFCVFEVFEFGKCVDILVGNEFLVH